MDWQIMIKSDKERKFKNILNMLWKIACDGLLDQANKDDIYCLVFSQQNC